MPNLVSPVSGNLHRATSDTQMFDNATVRYLLQKGGEYLLVAQAVAVIGSDSTVELVAGVTGLEIHTAATALSWLARVQLVSRHGLLREELRACLTRSLPIDIQTGMHTRAALLLHKCGAPAGTVARHLVKVRRVQFPWAPKVLRQAADEALAADEVRLAVRYLESVYKLACREEDRAEICAQLALIEWRINASAVTRNFSHLLRAIYSQTLPPRLSVPIAHYLLWHGRCDDANATLELLDCPSRDAEGTVGEQLRFHQTFVAYLFPGLSSQSTSGRWKAERLESGGEAQDLPASQAADLIGHIRSDCGEDDIARRAYLILSQHRLAWSTTFPLMIALEGLLYIDRFDVAASWCDALRAEAAARRSVTWQALFSAVRAEISLRSGSLVEAIDQAKHALSHLRPEASGAIFGSALSTLVCALVATGSIDEAQAQMDRDIPSYLYETRHSLPYLHARGQVLLNTDRPAEALRDFEYCGALMQRWQMDIPGLVAWRNDAAAAYLALGDVNAARASAQAHIERLGGATTHSTAGESLRLIAATLNPANRIPVLRQAEAIARRTHRRYELAVILSDLSLAHARTGDRQQSRSFRHSACQLAIDCGSMTLLKRLSYDFGTPRRVAAPRPPLDSGDATQLSLAEQRVAEAAAQGSSNREIAQSLGITISTVEQHLTRIFKKLGITRRTELRFLTRARTGPAATSAGDPAAWPALCTADTTP